ncbi:MAG: NAD-dependent deacylase [Candidatus Coatesbacteria bacterium]|nr:MAG: NAD-dependent deacylase [Candidatus Coatesbacteria bacterium]
MDASNRSDRLVAAAESGGGIVILAGAGMSAESGVPTFRGADGLWRNFRAEDLATPGAFARDPVLVWEWYEWRRGLVAECEPNAAHSAVTELENRVTGSFLLVTQNVDGLHRVAGTRNYREVHGCLWETRCLGCGDVVERRDHPLGELPPKCTCGGTLRPNVVWFGENLPEATLSSAFAAAGECDVMVVAGTSGVVYPIAHLPRIAKDAGGYVIEVNLERTPISTLADEVHLGPAGEVLPDLVGVTF